MSSSSSSSFSPPGPAIASSSKPRTLSIDTADDAASDDGGFDLRNDELLSAEDPLSDDTRTSALNGSNSGISFKRQQKASRSFAARFLASSPFNGSRAATPTPTQSDSPPARGSGRSRFGLGRFGAAPSTNAILSYLNTAADAGTSLNDAKHQDAGGLDWYIEGPGRRVGYDNLTAIDWIYEYAKERTRLRQLAASAPGLLGQLRLAADASQVWWILIATGIAVGAIAAGIDVASDWLGDMKTGVCSNVQDGGKFYLNKVFCCWGVESQSECSDWRPWSAVMGVGSKGGGYIIEYIVFVLFSIFFATVASLLTVYYSLYAKQSGIPEIKTVLGGFVIRRFLGAWTLTIKAIGLCLAVASGMWLGKEGPLVHVACCCANLFMKLMSSSINENEARKRELFSAAAASGISVAFGAPIGGVLFSLEQLSYYFPDKTMWASFVCAMVAAVTLQAFDPFRTGKLVLYQVVYHSGWHAFELIPFAIIGVIGGLYGGLFIKLNMRIAALRQSPRYPFYNKPILEVAVMAIITAVIGFPITFLRAQSSELVEYLFAECRDISDDSLGLCKSGIANTGVIFLCLISACIGFIFASLTFGLQIPAGILLPSMAIGALYGRCIGLIMEVWQQEHPSWIAFASCEPDIPCVTPGTYAVIGAASALAGATRMTVSIVVIMFELTGALTYVLPIMIAVMIGKWVGDAFGKRGIYESWIHFNSYPFLDNRDEGAAIPDVPVAHVMTRVDDLVCIPAVGHTVDSLTELLAEHRFRGFPVVSTSTPNTATYGHAHDPVLLGYISRTELSFALASATSPPRTLPGTTECYFQHQPLADPSLTLDLRPWIDQTPITLRSTSSLLLTNDMFQKLGLRYIVFTSKGGVLAGLMTKKDLWTVLNREEEVGLHRARGDPEVVGGLREEREGMNEDERGLLGGSGGDDEVGGGRNGVRDTGGGLGGRG
ncbi:hypothetical protein K431DRAFT_284890 [Polychaeton citri CBS 116435]|uniref:Chloride channel protein n=1 Tax=Polychaeton citri CBS 116435 TaxID=1314669 RepID=A0A9P4Q8N5_9PEZI|nr:hypothetical protein K431DRAFT_284890 [Polychaeton citri CBS 116435]